MARPRARRPRTHPRITLHVHIEGQVVTMSIPDNARILDMLRMDDTLEMYDYLYAADGYEVWRDGGTLGTKDTPKKLGMSSVAHLYAIEKDKVTDKQALIGHIRSEGMDVTKFEFKPVNEVDDV